VAGEAVHLPGQTSARIEIRDGDYIVGDGDGVVVIPAEVVGQIVEDAEELLRIEKKIGIELRAGGARHEVFKANPRFAHIRSAI
jgi:regulator of RNase E activity RraA